MMYWRLELPSVFHSFSSFKNPFDLTSNAVPMILNFERLWSIILMMLLGVACPTTSVTLPLSSFNLGHTLGFSLYPFYRYAQKGHAHREIALCKILHCHVHYPATCQTSLSGIPLPALLHESCQCSLLLAFSSSFAWALPTTWALSYISFLSRARCWCHPSNHLNCFTQNCAINTCYCQDTVQLYWSNPVPIVLEPKCITLYFYAIQKYRVIISN